MPTAVANSEFEAAILGRVVDLHQPAWPPEAARALLNLSLPDADRERMNELADKASLGTLATDEELEIEGYRHVCRFLDLVKARARASLVGKSAPPTPPQ